MFVNNTGFNYYFNYLLTEMPIELGYFQYFVQLPDIRKAIHVGSMKWNSGDEVRYKNEWWPVVMPLWILWPICNKICLIIFRLKNIFSEILCNQLSRGLKSFSSIISKKHFISENIWIMISSNDNHLVKSNVIHSSNYRVLIYNGQLDIIIGWPLSDNFVRSLQWSGSKKFINATREKW